MRASCLVAKNNSSRLRHFVAAPELHSTRYFSRTLSSFQSRNDAGDDIQQEVDPENPKRQQRRETSQTHRRRPWAKQQQQQQHSTDRRRPWVPQHHSGENLHQGAAIQKHNFQQLAKYVDELVLPLSSNKTISEAPDTRNSSKIDLPNAAMLKEALAFFSSKHVNRMTFGRGEFNPDLPRTYVKKLVDVIQYHYRTNECARGEWVQYCVGSSGEALINGMKMFLNPLRGNSTKRSNPRHNRMELHEKYILELLMNATHIHHFLIELMEDSSSNQFKMTIEFWATVLELWKCRCWFFGLDSHSIIPLEEGTKKRAFDGAGNAEQCIEIMTQLIQQIDSTLGKPHEDVYSIYVNALCLSGLEGAADRASQVLRQFEEKQKPRKDVLYNATMQAYAMEARFNRSAVYGARKLWDHIVAQGMANPIAATTLLSVYANAQMPREAEEWLYSLENASTANGIKLSRIDYNIVINSWVKSSHPDATERALDLFKRMVELTESRINPAASPDTVSYTIMIEAFARDPTTGTEGLEQVDYLFKRAESGDDPNVTADATMYLSYMSALSKRLTKSKRGAFAKVDIAKRIEATLRLMREMSKNLPASTALAWHNASIYELAIAAWSKSGSSEAAERALQLFKEFKQESQKVGSSAALQASPSLYENLLICLGSKHNSWGNGFDVRAVSVAGDILREIESRGLPLTIRILNPYLRVLSASGIPSAIQLAEQTLQSLEETWASEGSKLVLDTMSYQSVMEGYARSPGGAEHTERLLNQMICLSDQHESRKASLAVNNACITIVMNAWSRSGRKDAFDQTARIMEGGEKLGLPPSTHSYTTLINALALSCDQIEDAPERAEALLAQMQSDYESGKNPLCRPTDAAFSAVIKCWQASGREDAPDHIDAIVMRMKEISEKDAFDGVDINFSAFRHAILAWMKFTDRRPEAGDKAIKILDIVEEHHKAGKLETSFALHCYNSTLITIARSRDGEKAPKAYLVLKRMKDRLRVRHRDYRAVLSACRETGVLPESTDAQKEEAFRIANITFLEYLESGLSPIEDVYWEMIGLHNTLLPGGELSSKRNFLLANIFLSAPRKIKKSSNVRGALRAGLPLSFYENLIREVDKEGLY